MKTAIIGSGFSSLSAACYLAQAGYEVEVFEKNDSLGGRARVWSKNGYRFDMGPSWYWMPDVFERFFADFGKQPSDFYELQRLDPSYQVVWDNEIDEIPADRESLSSYFERYEPGSAEKLDLFLNEAKQKYDIGMGRFVEKPALSWSEFMQPELLTQALQLDLFKSISKHIRQYFSHPRLIQLLEFPVLFLGAKPEKTPALYSMMNYADMVLGTWYPKNGMNEVVKAMVNVAESLGVKFHTNASITSIAIENGTATGLMSNGEFHAADVIVSGADYAHTEQLIPPTLRNYSPLYWEKRVMAPSSLIYYVGIDTKIEGMDHHTLFFDRVFDQHSKDIYDDPQWPDNPLFYISCTSKSDPTTAPSNGENLFILIPVSSELNDNEAIRERYFNMVCKRIESRFGVNIKDHIKVYRSYAKYDFEQDYNSLKGNAYGLANTLTQTAVLKPKCRNKKIQNLFYTGQLTVPGPGVPPAIISGRIVANLINKEYTNETPVRIHIASNQ